MYICAICDKLVERRIESISISRCCCDEDNICLDCLNTISLKEYVEKCVK